MQYSASINLKDHLDEPRWWSTSTLTSHGTFAHLAGPLLISLVFLTLMITSWRTWPDVLIDFGREVYVPWRLSEGAVLYRDVAYFNGPLSPTLNAGLFRLFGDSLTTLIVANLVLLAILTSVIYHWLARHADRLAATLATTLFLCLFGFGHLVTVGNYNFVCPYAHELTHGITLSVFLLVLLPWRVENFSCLRLSLAGLCLGLIFLGKAEIFVAATGCVSVALLGSVRSRAVVAEVAKTFGAENSRKSWRLPLPGTTTLTLRTILAGWAWFALAAIVPPAYFLITLGSEMPLREAALGVAGSWRWIVSSQVVDLPFYKAISGTDRPATNMLATLEAILAVGLILGAAWSYDRAQNAGHGRRWSMVALVAALCAICLRGSFFPILLDARMLTAAAILISGSFLYLAWRHRREPNGSVPYAPLAGWAVLSALLLTKMALAPKIHHYGFVLAMPATLLVIVCLVKFLPPLVRGGPTFRRIVIGLLMVDGLGYVLMSSSNIQKKHYSVGSGQDRVATYDPAVSMTGPAIATILCQLEATLPADATLVVLPEGIMLNYLARRINPAGYTNMMPPEVLMYGENHIVERLESSCPGYVVLIDKDTSEYGMGPFGSPAYGKQILHWVRENYQPVKTLLDEPFSGDQFGIQLLRRSTKSAS